MYWGPDSSLLTVWDSRSLTLEADGYQVYFSLQV